MSKNYHELKFYHNDKEVAYFEYSEKSLLFNVQEYFKMIRVSKKSLLCKSNTFNEVCKHVSSLVNNEYIRELSFKGHELNGDIPVHVHITISEDQNSGAFRICSKYNTTVVEFDRISDDPAIIEIDSPLKMILYNKILNLPDNVDINNLCSYIYNYKYKICCIGNALYVTDIYDETKLHWKESSIKDVLLMIEHRIKSLIDDEEDDIQLSFYKEDLKVVQQMMGSFMKGDDINGKNCKF